MKNINIKQNEELKSFFTTGENGVGKTCGLNIILDEFPLVGKPTLTKLINVGKGK